MNTYASLDSFTYNWRSCLLMWGGDLHTLLPVPFPAVMLMWGSSKSTVCNPHHIPHEVLRSVISEARNPITQGVMGRRPGVSGDAPQASDHPSGWGGGRGECASQSLNMK